MKTFFNLFKKAIKNPKKLFNFIMIYCKTSLFKIACRILRKRVFWGKGLRITGKVIIKGPGKLILGDYVTMSMRVTPWTYDKNALIQIGNNVFLNGTKFGCKKYIEIGNYSIIGECRIQDTNFHSLYINRHDEKAPIKIEPVIIGQNVWIAPDCQLLPGASIGNNSVIGINSVVNSKIDENTLAAGNPAKAMKTLTYYKT